MQQENSVRKVALASTVGATIEWYDFYLYGTAAGLVFNQLFFPPGNPTIGTLAAYATFAASFIARPIGGMIFGHYGDRIGRKKMLVLTMLIMGIATFAIGLLPTYSQIGIWAPILLLAIRLLQGIGLGGEWGGAVLMAVEHAPEGRRGFYGSWPQIGVPAGLLLGTSAFSLAAFLLPEEQFLAWGWRLAFLASGLLVAVGLYIRLRIIETPAFSQVETTQTRAQVPIVELFRVHPKETVLGVCTRFAQGVSFNVYGVFVISYLTAQLDLSRSTALVGVSIGALAFCVLVPIYGSLSDKVGRKPVFGGGVAAFGLLAIPSFLLFNTENTVWVILTLVVLLGFVHPAMEAPVASFWSELFETRVRYTGLSFVFQFSGIFASGLTPLIATALLTSNDGRPWLLGGYMVAAALVSAVAILALNETYRSNIFAETASTKKRGTDQTLEHEA